MFSKSQLLALLATTAAASPVRRQETRSGNFVLRAADSGSSIQNAPINANGGTFWIGKNTSAEANCDGVTGYPPCPTVDTLFYVVDNSTLFLDVMAPSSQQVWIAESGLLSYSPGESDDPPAGSTFTNFTYVQHDNELDLTTPMPLWACPSSPAATEYQIHAIFNQPANECLQIGTVGDIDLYTNYAEYYT